MNKADRTDDKYLFHGWVKQWQAWDAQHGKDNQKKMEEMLEPDLIDADGRKHFFRSQSVRERTGLSDNKEIFETYGGLKFWMDADDKCFKTEHDDIYIYIYDWVFIQNQKRLFVVHNGGRSIAFSKNKRDMLASRSADYCKITDTRIWTIGGIGGDFQHRDPDYSQPRVYHQIANAHKFLSRGEQEFAVQFVTDALSNYSSALLNMSRKKNEVIFTDELQQKLANGDLIEAGGMQ